MSNYDKYEPMGGGFKAPLAAAIATADVGKIRGVGLDANGRVVFAAGQTGIKGLGIANQAFNAGDAFDTMTDGEIVDATLADGTTVLAAGTNYYVDTAGVLSATNTGTYVGHTVEAGRLIVRFAR